jgi:ergothioneine biosynthesis protein EgtB
MSSSTEAAAQLQAARTLDRRALLERYRAVRQHTESFCKPLEIEDYVVQPMTDASPTKWHLAHTTWFFEAFVLDRFDDGYEPFRRDYLYLFNSYYQLMGPRHARPKRGMITRPTVADVYAYRTVVDERVAELLDSIRDEWYADAATIIEIGLNHEQQHQELMVTDLKYLLWCNPLMPAYRDALHEAAAPAGEMNWRRLEDRLHEIGHTGEQFAYDNETPRHRVYLHAFDIADRLVTNAEYLRFIEDGGYERPELWLDMAWAQVETEQWTCPLYWFHRDGTWLEFTMNGSRMLDPNEPACHISYFEADAYARWADARLATEAEWEVACADAPMNGAFAESERFHPVGVAPDDAGGATIRQAYGDVWQWTQSQYLPYPGFRPPRGALGEYNAKFMCNQFVLRGGSCATPRSHIRPTYRNFFPPDARWQFAGIRLARSAQ